MASASLAAEKENNVVRIHEVQGSIESFLKAVAVNGEPIEPTASPKAAVGDVVTFEVSISNNSASAFHDLKSETEWGHGFSYQDHLAGENIDVDYDKPDNKIIANIPEILPETADTPCTYTFALKVTGCKDLFIHVYSDESYACQAVKTYYLALQINYPKICYTVSPSSIDLADRAVQTVNIAIENTGAGKAAGFILDTNFEDLPVAVDNIASGFTYDPASGIFRRTDVILPEEVLMLEFGIKAMAAWKNPGGAFSAPITFMPVYTGTCGTEFEAPGKYAELTINGKADAIKPPDMAEAAELELRVSPECRRVLSPQEPMTWTVYVMNRGSATAYDVELRDVLGRNLRFEQAGIDGTTASPKILTDTPAPGVTSVVWALGDMKPADIRKATVTAYPLDKQHELDSYFNTVRLKYGDGGECCDYREVDAPCFILPDECIDGEVFERCGRVHGFFSITQMYKSNLYKTADDPEGVWATYLTPGIWAAVPGSCERIVEIVTSSASPGGMAVSPFYPKTDRKYQSYLLYSPQYEIYYDHSDQNMVTHRADAYFRYNTRNKFSIRALDQFKRSHDSISARAFTIDDRYKSNLFNTLGTLDLTEKLRLRLDYSNFYLDYDSSENSRADRMDNSWAAYGYFNFTPKTAIFVNYEFADIDYDSNDLDSQENRLFAGLRWDITKKTSGQVKAGFGEKDYDQPGLSDLDTWMAEVQVDHSLTTRTNVVLNAYRRYDEVLGELVDKDDLKENFTKGILTHFIGLSLNYDFTTKLHLSLDTTLFYDEYKDEERRGARKERQDTEFAISPAVNFDFMKWLTFDLAYTYTNRDSNYSQFDYEDHTVFLRASLYQ